MRGCYRLAAVVMFFLVWMGQAIASPATTAVIGQRMEQLGTKGKLSLYGRNIAARGLVQKFYTNRDFSPAWGDRLKVRQLMALIEASATHGLNPNDYFQAQIGSAMWTPAHARSASQEADLDILMTDALFRYAYHRAFGKVNGTEIDNDINFRRQLFRTNAPEVSAEMALKSESLEAFIESALPQSAFYQSLRKALVKYLELASAGGWETVPNGPLLRPGNQDSRVPGLRRRLRGERVGHRRAALPH